MSRLETFLRWGAPLASHSDFGAFSGVAADRAEEWRCFVLEPLLWVADPQTAVPHRPLCLLLFACPSPDPASWGLIRYTTLEPHLESDSTEQVAAAAREISGVALCTAAGQRPDRVAVTWVADAPVEGCAGGQSLRGTMATRVVTVAMGTLGAENSPVVVSSGDDSGIETALAALTWGAQSSLTPLQDVTDAPLLTATPPPEEDAAAWTELHRELVAKLTAVCCGTGLTARPAAVAESGLDPLIAPLRYPSMALVGRPLTTSSPEEWATGIALSWAVTKRVADLERVSGFSAEEGKAVPDGRLLSVRLHRDPGDTAQLHEACSGSPNASASYRDMLHDDGEVTLQLGPRRGACFADVAEVDRLGWGAAALVPRAFIQCPCGTASRPSPVHAVVADVARLPLTRSALAGLVAALDVLQLQDPPAAVLRDGVVGRGLVADPEPLIAAAVPCRWCTRRRLRNQRCGGCKAVAYCGAGHQRRDWEDGHKVECRAIRGDVGELDAVFGAAPAHSSAVDSDAAVIAALAAEAVRRCTVAPGVAPGVAPVVIVVHPTDPEALLPALAKATAAASAAPHRLLLVGDAVPQDRAHSVVALCSDGAVVDAPGSGAVGDWWHTQGPPLPEGATRARLCFGRLHHIADRGVLPAPCDTALVVHCGRSAAGVSFFDAFGKTMLEHYAMAPAPRPEVAFTEVTRAAMRNTMAVLKKHVVASELSEASKAAAAAALKAAVVTPNSEACGPPPNQKDVRPAPLVARFTNAFSVRL